MCDKKTQEPTTTAAETIPDSIASVKHKINNRFHLYEEDRCHCKVSFDTHDQDQYNDWGMTTTTGKSVTDATFPTV